MKTIAVMIHSSNIFLNMVNNGENDNVMCNNKIAVVLKSFSFKPQTQIFRDLIKKKPELLKQKKMKQSRPQTENRGKKPSIPYHPMPCLFQTIQD